jgi:putative SOS response-associated peptidase YedK
MSCIRHRYDRWLTVYDESRPPIDLLRPFEADGMRMTPANRLVGNVHNNGPENAERCVKCDDEMLIMA